MTDATSLRPALAGPPRFRGRLPFRELMRRIRDSTISTWPEEAFEDEFWERRILWQRTFVANCPDAVRHVLLDNADNYLKSRLARRLLEPGIGRGLLTSEDEEWRRQRRLMAPAFQHKRIVGFAPAIVAAALRMLADWRTLDAPFDVAKAMSRLTLAIISEIMFSTGDDPAVARIAVTADGYQRTVRPGLLDFLGAPAWIPRSGARKARRLYGSSAHVVDAVIERRRAAPDPGCDLLGLLLAKPESGDPPMTPREVHDQVATIFSAGHETTANALTWTWYLLALHPEAEAKLHTELDQVLGPRAAAYDDIDRLRYTRMVIDEALRLYPPAHTMSREPIADDVILGHKVPRGSTVIIAPWLLHRHRRLWSDPEAFAPERMAPELAAARPRYAYIPFGAGPRICIGASLALTEAVLILATVAQRFRLRLVAAERVEPVGLITLRPRDGMWMRLEPR